MTNPNWWDVEPYRIEKMVPKMLMMPEKGAFFANVSEVEYDLPLIIAEVEKRGETKVKHVSTNNRTGHTYACQGCENRFDLQGVPKACPHCGSKVVWDK